MRLYIQMIYPIFILLIWLKYWAKLSLEEIHAVVFNDANIQAKMPKNSYAALRNVCSINRKSPSYTIESLIDIFQERIRVQVSEEDNHEGDIIDLIIKTFNIPFGYNVINGKGIEKLKRALISPNELNILNEHIKNQEKSCASCGRELKDHSMCTIEKHEGSFRIFCITCKPPVIVPCKNCGEYMPFTSQFSTKKSIDCSLHKKDRAEFVFKDDPEGVFRKIPLKGPAPVLGEPKGYVDMFKGPAKDWAHYNNIAAINYGLPEVDPDQVPPIPKEEDFL